MKSRSIRRQSSSRILTGIILAGSLVATPALFAEESHQHEPTAIPVGWQQQLKGQTIVEDAIEGRGERSEMHHRHPAQHHPVGVFPPELIGTKDVDEIEFFPRRGGGGLHSRLRDARSAPAGFLALRRGFQQL